MMKRTQLYIQEELHEILSRFALANGWTLSQAFRKAIEEFVEKPKVKRIIKTKAKKTERKNPLADMVGVIRSGDPNMSKNIDEIYDED